MEGTWKHRQQNRGAYASRLLFSFHLSHSDGESRVQRLYDRLGDRSRWKRFLEAAKDFKEAISARIKGEEDEASALM